MYSVIVPVYRVEAFIPDLLEEFSNVSAAVRTRFDVDTEFVFVVDGSPDNSFTLLEQQLVDAPFRSRLISHSRNFGSFAAIRTGLAAAGGDRFATISADLQEPPSLLVDFFERMRQGFDIVVGVRSSRSDPTVARVSAGIFWRLFRRFVIPDLPPGGVDMFACTQRIRDHLLTFEEANSSLIAQLYWIGHARSEVAYERRARRFGESGWTFRRKLDYLLNSVLAFTDLPIRILAVLGIVGLMASILMLTTAVGRAGFGASGVDSGVVLAAIVTFLGSLQLLALGVIGAYVWRAYDNTKRRPLSIVSHVVTFEGRT